MEAGTEGGDKKGEAPHRPHFEAVEIEMTVIDRRIGGHDITAAIEAAVSDGDLHRPGPATDLLFGDEGRKAPRLGQRSQRRDRITEAAPALLQVTRKLAGEVDGQTDRRDVEKWLVIDAADIDLAAVARDDDIGRGL